MQMQKQYKKSISGNLEIAEGATTSFIIEEAKNTILDFSKVTVKVLWIYSALI